MKYFFITGYLADINELTKVSLPSKSGFKEIISPFRVKDKNQIAIKRILSIKKVGSINKFKYDNQHGIFLIITNSQRNGYKLGMLFKHLLSIYFQQFILEDEITNNLVEINGNPTSFDSMESLIQSNFSTGNNQADPLFIENKLKSGNVIPDYTLQQLKDIFPVVISSETLTNALDHLYYSHVLFSGSMTGSYYASHYSHDRKNENRYDREKQFLENKVKLELAFLSAFRSIEIMLETPNLSKSNIKAYLEKVDKKLCTCFATSITRRHFEIFSGKKKKITYTELIQWFLLLRNSVAAHGNRNPRFLLHVDQVFEIQKQCEDMLYLMIFPDEMIPPKRQ